MSISNLHTLTPAEFERLRYEILSQLEGNEPLPYTDSAIDHHPTIGIGFNLDVEGVRDRVFTAMGITDQTMVDNLTAVITNPGIRALPTKIQRDNELRRQLNEVYGSSFEMTDAQILEVFNYEVDERQDRIQRSSGITTQSLELIVLVSAEYSNVYGSGLRAALAMEDPQAARAEAWYQLRYYSNGDGQHGKRRYIESELFGLYGEGTDSSSITTEQSLHVYRMYTEHKQRILQYESMYQSLIAAANADIAAIEGIAGAQLPEVGTLQQEFQPAYEQLISEFGEQDISVEYRDIQVADEEGGILSGHRRNEWALSDIAPEVNSLLIGSENTDALFGKGADDILHGLGGQDVLHGGGGTNYLYGGRDNDYYFINGSGTNTAVDEQGDDTYVINGAGGQVNITDSDGTDTYQVSGGASVHINGASTGHADLPNHLTGGAGRDLLRGGRPVRPSVYAHGL